MSRRIGALVAACGLALAGCGGAAASRPAHTTTRPAKPASLDGCVPGGTRVVSASAGEGETIKVALLGSAQTVVVLSEESDENLCSWLPLATHLVAKGYEVALWDYGGLQAMQEAAAVITAVRGSGASRLVLAGASEGAKVSLIEAASTPGVVAVLSLSAEAALQGQSVAPSVPRISCPVLLVTASADPYGASDAADQFMSAAPHGHLQLMRVPGSDHGTALLSGSNGPSVLARIDAFLSATAKP